MENVVRNALSVRARNVLDRVFHGNVGGDRRTYADLDPVGLRGRLLAQSQKDSRKWTVASMLRATRGCGGVVAHEILSWCGLEATQGDPLCVCRHCGREMG